MKQGIIFGAIAVVVIGVGLFLSTRPSALPPENDTTVKSYENMSSRELALLCDPQEHVVMHIHPQLSIILDGQPQAIPAGIGIEGLSGDSTHEQASNQASCLHFLHTHDDTGKLHVESPLQTDYKLSDFFAVWGKDFSMDKILDKRVDETHRIRLMVNGQENTEFENLSLKDNDRIEILYEVK